MKQGIKAIYHAYSNGERGYEFDLELEENINIRGTKLKSPEDRDATAKRIAEELGLILTME